MIGSSPRATLACFRARGAAALADKPNMRRTTAIKLSLYIFARVGGSVKRRILKGSDAVTAGVCMGKPLTL